MAPKVSICIPTYNLPDNLRKNLNSITRQTFKDFEIIITDDSTNDNVEQVVREFEPNIQIKYIKNAVRKGTPANWNYAISLASGDYIKLLHHDDFFSEDTSLDLLVKMLDENLNIDFAFCASLNFDNNQNFVNNHVPAVKDIKNITIDPTILFQGNLIGSPSATIYRRSINLEYDPNLRYLVDLDFYIRLLCKNKIFGFTQQALVSTLCQSKTQVTSEYLWNRSLEIYEYVYLYRKLFINNRLQNTSPLKVLWDLFSKYNIASEKELRECIDTLEIDDKIRTMFFFLKIRRKLDRMISDFLYFLYMFSGFRKKR